MRKIYVKKESLYWKPFYKQKCCYLVLLLVGLVFLGYQFFYVSQLKIDNNLEFNKVQNPLPTALNLNRDDEHKLIEITVDKNILRGIRFRDIELYSQKINKFFKCISTGKAVSFDKINDDYCDCPEDGSDEPGTSACKNGKFYCKYQKRHRTGRGIDVFVSSGFVNDGICDCCDCSDEFSKNIIKKNTCS